MPADEIITHIIIGQQMTTLFPSTAFSIKKIRPMNENTLRQTREALLMSKAELARAARVSPITISRIENGLPCRMETKRKIILALGLKISDKDKIFHD